MSGTKGTYDIRCSIDDSTGVPFKDFKQDSSPGADAAGGDTMASAVSWREYILQSGGKMQLSTLCLSFELASGQACHET